VYISDVVCVAVFIDYLRGHREIETMDWFHRFLLMAEGLGKQSQNGGAGLVGTPGMVLEEKVATDKRRPPRCSKERFE
jgi:hypothetical protein